MAGATTSADGGGGIGAPVQSIVTETVCGGNDLSKPVIVVVDGDVRPLTTTATPAAIPFCGLRTGDVGLFDEDVTTEYVGTPPVMTNWNVLAGTQLFLAIAPGVTVNGPGGGAGGADVPS